jgi:Holliday junction resolvase RusA-like endonuclease
VGNASALGAAEVPVILDVLIPGPPVPKARPRFVNGRTYTPKRTRDYEAHVAACARAACFRDRWRCVDGELHVELHVTFPDRRRRDLDNAAKAVLDALNGIVWRDDSQIARLLVERAYDPAAPGVRLTVREAT